MTTIYAVKAHIADERAASWTLSRQKTMYGGKRITDGDIIFVFASETQGGSGLIARGIVTAAKAIPLRKDLARQTPRVSITIKRTRLAKRRLGRAELKSFTNWKDGRAETELNFKFYRQATNKVVGLTERAAAFLDRHF
jgi:hypothetical protein